MAEKSLCVCGYLSAHCYVHDSPPITEESLVEQCTATESGGTQCEVLLLTPDETHAHWVSQETINRRLGY